MFRFAPLIAAAALTLSGCERGGSDDRANAANQMPTSRTENGQLTARVGGVDLKVNLPPPIRRMTEGDDFLYPGARTQRGGTGQRFHSDDAPETVAAWYQAPARANRFRINNVSRDGSAFVLAGTARSGDTLSVRLAPGTGGGTDGTLVVTAAD
jgi:hypothetical protein